MKRTIANFLPSEQFPVGVVWETEGINELEERIWAKGESSARLGTTVRTVGRSSAYGSGAARATNLWRDAATDGTLEPVV